MRVFAGTFLNPFNQLAARWIADALTGRHPRVLRAIPNESAHLTYAFVADTGDRPLSLVVDAIGRRAALWRPFDVRLGRARILPSESCPRLVCLDIEMGALELQGLSTDLAAAVRDAFPDMECSSSTSPHVTIARFRKRAGRDDADGVGRSLTELRQERPLAAERIDDVAVVESTLTAAGPVYEVRARVPLSGGNSELA